jgi:hypothetical protein
VLFSAKKKKRKKEEEMGEGLRADRLASYNLIIDDN